MANVAALHNETPVAPRPCPRTEPTSYSDPDLERRSHIHTTMEQALDKGLKAAQARFTGGISPIALAAAYADWALHLSSAPGKQLELLEKAGKKMWRFTTHAARCAQNPNTAETCITPLPQDKRFKDEAWQQWPFNMISQGFLLNQQWWQNATTGVAGVTRQHEDVVTFVTRQILDVFSPSNFALTNPEVLAKTASEGGMNLVRGW
ncbi:MAG: poly-beta-hydroxybutyrate polymerase N-terminal domain-containing protein, partial [Hoeflea sp.]|uniref:poly-beta-hydroxybutyrate polymerase N-terminal domain-containing protein n=1 Tax=Hoeflea sp. TaxID=1940281 RepID=UPI003EF15163